MSALTSAGDAIGLILLTVAATVLAGITHKNARRQLRAVQSVRACSPEPPARLRLPALRVHDLHAGSAAGAEQAATHPVLVEDRVPGPAPLELEKAVGARDQQHAVPEPRSSLAARDR